MRRDEVRGEASEARGIRDLERTHVLGDVLGELLAQLGQVLVDLLEPRTRRQGLVDTRAPIIAQGVRVEALGVRTRRGDIDRRERIEHLPIETEIGIEARDFLLALACGIADRLVGVDLGHQSCERVRSTRRHQQPVVAVERLLDRTCGGRDDPGP